MKELNPIIFTSKRLHFRAFSKADAKDLFELNNDPEVLKYTGDEPFKSLEEAVSFVENYNNYKKDGFGRWSVYFKDTEEFIGWCGLKLNEENLVDLGFRFFRAQWGNGYASEAAKRCIEYGFNNLEIQEITGRVLPENFASIRVLEKCGMTFKKTGTCHGMTDARYYSIKKVY